MTKRSNIPLHLSQVLEEEYESLQEEIVPECSWSFEPEHLKTSSQAFIVQLQKNLSDPLAKNLREGLLKFVIDRREDSSGVDQDLSKLNVTDEELIAFLNSQLDRPDLYEEDRFKHVILSDITLKLVNLNAYQAFEGQDRCHFNRLLLEDVYPDDFSKIHEIRLEKIYRRIQGKKQAALCFSGGGMRSGTLSLGILQGLARHGLLNQFNYLSTVSGGGYIGSWLSAWIYRHRKDLGVLTKI